MKPKPNPKRNESYTSIYLDLESREKLADLSVASGQSKSQVVRGLIQAANRDHHQRLGEIASELMELVGSR
jgi:hypothetical protein